MLSLLVNINNLYFNLYVLTQNRKNIIQWIWQIIKFLQHQQITAVYFYQLEDSHVALQM